MTRVAPLCPHASTCLLALLLTATGCQGSSPFSEGRYPEAASEFAAEPPHPDLLPAERAEDALHRGLTYLALGDASRALPWLQTCHRLLRRDPTLLTREERGALASAWTAMGQMPGD